jgi:hypothetical protein
MRASADPASRTRSFVISPAAPFRSIFSCVITSPLPRCTRRPVRVRLPGLPLATIRFGDGQSTSARLQIISITGGLLRVLKPLHSKAVVEVMFSTDLGPVLAMAELLNPCSAAPIGLQPFRFVSINGAELQKLRAAIASCLKNTRSGLICAIPKERLWV